MFGSNDDKSQKLVGAREKRDKAAQFRPHAYEIKSKKEGREGSKVVPLAVIYGIAVVFALILTEGVMDQKNIGIHTGNGAFDRMFFGPGIPSIMGSQETDRGIVIFLRGTMIFLAAGVLPLFTWLWQKIADGARMNVYLAFWGVTIGLGMIWYLAMDSLIPALNAVIDIFFG